MFNFLKSILAGFIGTVLGAFFLFFMLIIFIIGICVYSAMDSKKMPVIAEKDAILKIELAGKIVEYVDPLPFDFDLSSMVPTRHSDHQLGLYQLKEILVEAAKDNRIKALYLKDKHFSTNWAIVDSLAKALIEFKKSKKPIYYYTESFAEQNYLLSLTADKIFLYPLGDFEFNGLSITPTFFQGTLKKLGVVPMVFRAGKYKSAVEPFIRKDLSPDNRRQLSDYLFTIWDFVLSKVSESRKISVEKLRKISSDLTVTNAEKAFENKLVDELADENKVYEKIIAAFPSVTQKNDNKKRSKKNSIENENGELDTLPRFVSDKEYYHKVLNVRNEFLDKNLKKDQIAIVFATGEVTTSGKKEVISSDELAGTFRLLRNDNSVKAVIVRIDSPGGYVVAADVIHNEIYLTNQKKPVYISMGGMAASGGYYIAAPGTKIVADPLTLTGSIGVFSIFANLDDLFVSKFGITHDKVATDPFADIMNPFRKMSEYEHKIIQNQIDYYYERFLDVVAHGRKMKDIAAANELAQGRIWSGKMAQERGLVDKLGDLDDTINLLLADNKWKKEDFYIGVAQGKRDWEYYLALLLDNASLSLLGNTKIPALLTYYLNTLDSGADQDNRNRVMMLLPNNFEIR